jgi:hypothetical protein
MGGRTFDIDAFLEFMPGQEGEAWEKRNLFKNVTEVFTGMGKA